jgi:NhaC family Na+:H+ antiporter
MLLLGKATDEEREGWKSSGEAISEFNSDGTPKVEDEDTEEEDADDESDKSGQ